LVRGKPYYGLVIFYNINAYIHDLGRSYCIDLIYNDQI
jgi:hypothetical protein